MARFRFVSKGRSPPAIGTAKKPQMAMKRPCRAGDMPMFATRRGGVRNARGSRRVKKSVVASRSGSWDRPDRGCPAGGSYIDAFRARTIAAKAVAGLTIP